MVEAKTVIVTGGSRGIGAATAAEAAIAGYNVVFSYKEDKTSASNTKELIQSKGVRCLSVQANSSNENEMRALFDCAIKEFGRIDALVNNAAIVGQKGCVADLDIDMFEEVIKSNLSSVAIGMKLASEYMSTEKGGNGGVIVNMSSQAAEFGGSGIYAYAASKAGVNAITKSTARELASQGIRVNAISPGIIKTDMHNGLDDLSIEKMENSLPFSRMGSPYEVASLAIWLMSEKASYVSGAIIPVTGAR